MSINLTLILLKKERFIMKTNLTKEEKNALAIATTVAVGVGAVVEIVLASKLLTLVSRGNKALKIYIDKNKKPKRRARRNDYDYDYEDFFYDDDEESNYAPNEDIPF